MAKANITTRPEAKRLGLRHYFTGKPCPKGHNTIRFTSNGTCADCLTLGNMAKKESGYFRERYLQNRDEFLRACKVRYRKNRKRVMRTCADWVRRKPEKRRAISQNYKHRRRSQEATGMSSSELQAWAEQQAKICYWCGSKCDAFHVDHYQPLAKGGTHTADNLVIACPTCNLQKSAKDPYEFAAQVGRLF